jgi:hypothetical protein
VVPGPLPVGREDRRPRSDALLPLPPARRGTSGGGRARREDRRRPQEPRRPRLLALPPFGGARARAPEVLRLVDEPEYRSVAHRVFSYASRGRYAEQLEGWIERFGPANVHVLRSEDLYRDPASAYASVVDFLGLPFAGDPEFRVHAASRGRDDDMPAQVRARLVDEFRPANARLETLLGRTMGWDA